MQLTTQDRSRRARLAQDLADLAGAPVPATLTVTLYDLQRRGHHLQLVRTDDELDQAAEILHAADQHALLILNTADRRRFVRTRAQLQPLGHPAPVPHQLRRLIPRADAVRYKHTTDAGYAVLITLTDSELVIIYAHADHGRHVSRRTREGLQHRRRNNHAPRAQIRDQAAQHSAARVAG